MIIIVGSMPSFDVMVSAKDIVSVRPNTRSMVRFLVKVRVSVIVLDLVLLLSYG
jgi:hypothetical protein